MLKCLLTPPNTVVLEVSFACKWLALKANLEMPAQTMDLSFGDGGVGKGLFHG